MPRAPINGIRLYYESHGSGPAIVFAHGRGGNHMSWWQQVARFSGDYRCVTFDHRGWGKSRAQYGSPLRPNFLPDLIALLDYLEVEQTFLVAQSMGGYSCLEFALACPERTLGLVLGDTTGGVTAPGVLAELSKTNPPKGVARSLAPGFMAEQPALTFLYRQIRGLNPKRGKYESISGFRRGGGRQESDFVGWRIPTLLIVGDEDTLFPPGVIAEVQKVIPGSRMEIVPGAAHSTYFEKADEFNALVSGFLSGILAGRTAGAPAD